MNELKIFESSEFGQIRTVTIDGEPWFVGKDVAVALGYEKARNAIAAHVDEDDALKWGITDSLGRTQNTTIINESGLYSLILSSKLESAKRFKRWVTSEVLPTIRKTGRYEAAKTYPPKATSVGEVVNLIRVARETMQEQGCSAADIATAVKEICIQFGVNLPACFVRPKGATLDDAMDMIDFIYSHKGKRKPTYDEFIMARTVRRLEG